MSDYERQRLQRIAENQELFKQLFPVSPLRTPKQAKKVEPNAERCKRSARLKPYSAYPTRRNPSRHCRGRRRVRYGSDCEDKSSDYEPEDDEEECEQEDFKPGGLVVKLWGKKTQSNDLSVELKRRSPKKTTVDREDILKTYNSLTEDDLVMVAAKTSDKNYDQSGTTCHQCRQKTDDLKTICRSDSCFGVRGQFCGPCLRNRYGEDAKAAIMDRTWICPPCRGICNCSFCMPKRGRRATGILIHLAKEKGFQSVKAFLGD